MVVMNLIIQTNMARIRIKKGPTNSSVPNQMAPAFNGLALQKPSTSTARQLKAVPRDEANIEAERGETALVPNKDGLAAHFTIGGNRHTGGGTPLNVPKDTFIFSDTKKMRIKDPEVLAEFGKSKGSWTPADLAKKYDINKYRKILADPDSDKLDISTAEKMMGNYNLKLGKLALVQEAKKGFPQGIPAVAMPYLSTFNIQPDSILPLKAEQEQGEAPDQEQGEMPMGRYGRFLTKAQAGAQYLQPLAGPAQSDLSNLTLDPSWNDMQGPPSTIQDMPGAGNVVGLQQPSQGIGNPWDQGMASNMPITPQQDPAGIIRQDTQQLNLPDKPSMYSKGTAKSGFKITDPDWGIAAMNKGAQMASAPHNRRVQEQLDKRMKPEAWMASRADKDRGDYTTNYGYFRPDQQNVGNMVTGKYGGMLPKAQFGIPTPMSELDAAKKRTVQIKSLPNQDLSYRDRSFWENLNDMSSTPSRIVGAALNPNKNMYSLNPEEDPNSNMNFKDYMYNTNLPDMVKYPLGWAGNIALDPLTYVPARAIAESVSVGLKQLAPIAKTIADKGVRGAAELKMLFETYGIEIKDLIKNKQIMKTIADNLVKLGTNPNIVYQGFNEIRRDVGSSKSTPKLTDLVKSPIVKSDSNVVQKPNLPKLPIYTQPSGAGSTGPDSEISAFMEANGVDYKTAKYIITGK